MITMNTQAAECNLVWKDGMPPELHPENPYLPALNNHVVRALGLLKQGKKETFYLVWGATAPGSRHRENAALRDLAYRAYDEDTLERVEKPQGFWAIIGDLESLLLWQNEGRVPKEQIRVWQERLRPSVEANIQSVTDVNSWLEWAPNTLLQSAAILQLAVVSYGRENPADPDLERWAGVARENVRKALRMQLPGGAFSYIRNSGPDPVYFAFDTAHLGRYYQLTGDPEAAAALVRMVGWSNAATRSGWLTPFSSPWWKHIVGTGGPFTGPETLTSLADHPGMRGVMDKRRAVMQHYVWTYGNMYGWTPAAGASVPIADRCGFDLNANGPALRVGGFDVELPARAWGDSLAGASFSTDTAIRSCVHAVYLAANNHRNASADARLGQHAWIMLSEDSVKTHGGIVGEQWIAGAASFEAHLGQFGSFPPERSPWRRTDLWFASADGLVGALELRCVEAVDAQGVEVWVSHDGKVELGTDRLAFEDFELVVVGPGLAEPRMAKGAKDIGYFPIEDAGPREYAPGETFRADVSLRRPDHPVLTVANRREADGLHSFTVMKDGQPVAEVMYNASERDAPRPAEAAATLWQSRGGQQDAARPVVRDEQVLVRPWAVAVLLYAPKPQPATYRFDTQVEPSSGIVKAGEPVTFGFRLRRNGQVVAGLPVRTHRLVEGTPAQVETVASRADFTTIQAVQEQPGFIYFKADYLDPETGRSVTGNWSIGVAVDPEAITPALPEPEDFDAFWDASRKKLAAVPIAAERRPVAAPEEFGDGVEGFEVRIDGVGDRQVFGYLTQPKAAAAGSLPALALFPGGGYGKAVADWRGAKDGFLTISINAHGVYPGGTEDETFERIKEQGPYYTSRDWHDREAVYFHGILLRALRSVQYLKTLPEWNGRILVAYGASQGGAQALAVAGLEPDVTFCYAGIPGLCNLAGPLKNQTIGWPRNFNLRDERAVATTGYYDNCNFARRIRAETLMTVGYRDWLCSPSNIYAAYNRISGKKTLWADHQMGHSAQVHDDRARESIRRHAGL